MNSLSIKRKPLFPNALLPAKFKLHFKRFRKNHVKKFSLMSRIVILTFLISILPIALLISAMFYDYKSSINNDIKHSALQFNTNIMNEFNHTLDNESILLKLLAADSLFEHYSGSISDKNTMIQKFTEEANSKAFISSIFVKLENLPEPIGYSKNKAIKLTKDDIDGNYLYSSVMKKKELIISEPYFDDISHDLVITLSAPVLNKSNQPIGAVNMDISMTHLSKHLYNYISEAGMDPHINVMIYLDNGTIITSSDKNSVNGKVALLKGGFHIINGREQIFFADFMDGRYQFFRGTKSNGLNLISYVNTAYINHLVKSKLAPLCYTTLIVFIAAIVMGLIYARYFLKPIKHILSTLGRIKTNNLDAVIDTDKIKTKDIFEIAAVTNELVSSLRSSVVSLQDTSNQLVTDADSVKLSIHKCNTFGDKILKLVQNIFTGAQNQMDMIKRSIHSSSLLNKRFEETDLAKEQMLCESETVTNAVKNGVATLKDLKCSMNLNNQKLTFLKEEVTHIGNNSSEICTLLSTIQTLSKQTNLLAFNASIEASRSDRSEKGFGVIANEVKKLADASSSFAIEIEKIVKENLSSVHKLVTDVDAFVSSQSFAEQLLSDAEERFTDIQSAIASMQHSIDEMNMTLKDIAQAKDHVVSDINNIYSVAQETTASTELVNSYAAGQVQRLQEVLDTSEGLKNLSNKMEQMVNNYHL